MVRYSNLVIVTGTMPTLYGEVESSNPSDVKVLDRLNQATARILSNTDKCFAVYAKSDLFYIKLCHQDNAHGLVYVLKEHFSHSPIMGNVVPQRKCLADVVYGEQQADPQQSWIKGLDNILLDLVKVMLFIDL